MSVNRCYSEKKPGFEDIDLRCCDGRAFAAGEQLDALGAGVRTLVELTGQRLYRKDGVSAFRTGKVLVVAHISHRLGEYDALCLLHRNQQYFVALTD